MAIPVLVIGDGYMPVSSMTSLENLGPEFRVRFESVDPDARPPIDNLREYQGDPVVIDSWLSDETVLVVHAAPVTRPLLAAHPHIRLVACLRGGPVNIDLDAARDLGVIVTNAPGKNAASVADLTLTYVHSLLRGVTAAAASIRDRALAGETHLDSTFEGGKWIAREPQGLTMGLVGYGAVGHLVAVRARSYGMSILAHDPYYSELAEHSGSAEQVELVDLDTLASRSDVVSIHARYTEANRHLISADFVGRMKRGAMFINTAREGLVDESALLDGLTSGLLGGLALDVCEPDGLWPALSLHPNAIVTPHLGGATIQTQQRGLAMAINDIRRFADGLDPLHKVA
jgi:phosphoglycerate dehydrogenase-like enzyme